MHKCGKGYHFAWAALWMTIASCPGFAKAQVQDGSNANSTDQVVCIACGLAMVTPALDGAIYNLNGSDTTGKMYNWTCGFYDSLSDRFPGQDEQIKMWQQKFHRMCPIGVKNCFWAQAQYATQNPTFRGCAGAKFNHDVGCSGETKQAVTVVEGRKSTDVIVDLCYCSGSKVNIEGSSSATTPCSPSCKR